MAGWTVPSAARDLIASPEPGMPCPALEKVFMRFRTAFLLTLFSATSAFAVAPQFWRVRTAEEFLAGEVDGFTVTSRGELRPGPGLHKLAGFSAPCVLEQVTAPNSDRYFGTRNDGKG